MIGFLTIPPVELEKLENPLVCFYCLSGPLTFIFLRGMDQTEFFGDKMWINGLIGCLGLTLICQLIYMCGYKKLLSWIFAIICLPVCVTLLSTSAGVIVDVIKFFSITKDWNETLLSATLLALGNSLADFFANGSLASMGFAVMACTGSISGQFLNLIFGFGFNLINGTSTKAIEFDLFKFDPKDIDETFNLLIIATVMVILVIILVSSFMRKFKLTKCFAGFLFSLYLLMLVISFGGFYLLTKKKST